MLDGEYGACLLFVQGRVLGLRTHESASTFFSPHPLPQRAGFPRPARKIVSLGRLDTTSKREEPCCIDEKDAASQRTLLMHVTRCYRRCLFSSNADVESLSLLFPSSRRTYSSLLICPRRSSCVALGGIQRLFATSRPLANHLLLGNECLDTRGHFCFYC